MANKFWVETEVACEQALRGALAARREKEGEHATTTPIALWLLVDWAVSFLPISMKRKRARI